MHHLGVREHSVLSYQDGGCAAVDEAVGAWQAQDGTGEVLASGDGLPDHSLNTDIHAQICD